MFIFKNHKFLQDSVLGNSSANSSKFFEAKFFEFRRTTVFGLRNHVSKHKTTRYARNLWGMAHLAPLARPILGNRVF